MARGFERRWARLFRIIREEFPGFWEDLGDELAQRRARQYTDRGAVVLDWPTTRDVAVQIRSVTASIGVQAAPTTQDAWNNVRIRPARRDVAVGTGPDPPEAAGQAGVGGTPPSARPEANEGCWSCGSRGHYASWCPEPRRGDYCYRCGRRGVTVRTCERCGEGWRAEGPYRGNRNPRSPETPRRHGSAPNTRKGPY